MYLNNINNYRSTHIQFISIHKTPAITKFVSYDPILKSIPGYNPYLQSIPGSNLQAYLVIIQLYKV